MSQLVGKWWEDWGEAVFTAIFLNGDFLAEAIFYVGKFCAKKSERRHPKCA